jgi:guanylate kinase
MSEGAGAIHRRGLMLVLSSPSGAGKTTLSRRLLQADPTLQLSVSVTTRPRRLSEMDGVDYQFIDRDRYDAMVRNDELLEHAEVFGNCYGTPKREVEAALAAGRDVLFDIDWQGTLQLKQRVPADIVTVFILPPSFGELERRLHRRAEDSDEIIRDRMAKAVEEMRHYEDYDYIVVNHDLETAFGAVHAILLAERYKRSRQVGLPAFVRTLQADG